MIDRDVQAALDHAGELQKIEHSGPTARELVDAFGEDSLFVETPLGEVPGYVDERGIVRPMGKWRVAIARPDFSPERNAMRLAIFSEMMAKRRRMQEERSEEVHANTDHVLWKDADGIDRATPVESADQVIEKVGVQPMTHPRVWRPHG